MSLHHYPIPSRSSDCYSDESINQTVDEIMTYMKKAGNENYLGEQEESITQLSHSLQAGHQAKLHIQSNKQSNDQSNNQASDNELILASFLHDLGHMILSRPDSWTQETQSNDQSNDQSYLEQHEYVGFAYLLQRGFSHDIADLVLGHVQAKRYLTAVEPGYLNELSDASRMTLIGQGGPFSLEQAKMFETSRNFEIKLLMRRWDEAAKIVDWQCHSDELEEYGNLIRSHLNEQRDRAIKEKQINSRLN